MATQREPLAAQSTILHPPSRWASSYDEGEDVTAPKTRRSKYMNQSIVSMIASVSLGSSISPDYGTPDPESSNTYATHPSSARRRSSPPSPQDRRHTSQVTRDVPAVERRLRNDRRMLQSTPGLSRRTPVKAHSRAPSDCMLQSQILVRPTPPSSSAPETPAPPPTPPQAPKDEPAEEAVKTSLSTDIGQDLAEPAQDSTTEYQVDHEEASLSNQLRTMFGLDEDEDLVAEYPCSLLQGVHQQGYLYLLRKHICFYAYLPKRPSRTAKSGYLLKRGRRNPKFHRYWFILKGDVLSYHTQRSNQFFPRNTIDLRSDVSAILHDPTADGSCIFSLTTPQETFTFRSEDVDAANEWVEQIKRITFRSHHTGDSIKIRIPLKNVLDIEDVQMGSLANMLSIRYVEEDGSDDSGAFSVTECLFSFVGADAESLQKLRSAANESLDLPESSIADRASDEMEDVSLDEPVKTDSHINEVAEDQAGGADGLTASSQPEASSRLQSPSLSSSQQIMAHSTPKLARNDSYASITGLYHAGAERLRAASGLAGALGQRSKRMRSLLANESKGYYEKVSGMWAANKTHYDVDEVPVYQHLTDDDDGKNNKKHGDSFRCHFSLPASEKLRATFFVYLLRNVPIYGKIYVGSTKLCFRSLALPQTKMILPFKDVESVAKEKGFTNLGYAGVVLTIKGHEELFFEFSKNVARDDFALTMIHILDSDESLQDSKVLGLEDKQAVEAAKAEHELLERARRNSKQFSSITEDHFGSLEKEASQTPVIFDDLQVSVLDFRPERPLNITCLTIGSRGDVQPYIALCKGLLREGHQASIATHVEFESWVRSHGIGFKPVAGDPGKIMQLCVENDMFTLKFMQEAQKFRGFLDELFLTSWEACQDADLLIESPSAMAGIHIAEALKIPYFRAFTMPWSPTRAYPHAFAVMNSKMGGKWNRYSYLVFDWAFWQSTAGQLNRFRRKVLDLPKTTFAELRTYEVPFLYNFSPQVVSPPLDFGPHIHITGYWFLDEAEMYKPPHELLAFIRQARSDSKKLAYIGFGSITVDDPAAVTRAVCEAVQDADVRCILCKGWSDRLDKKDPSVPEIPLPDTICPIKAAPHDWLFTQVDAAVHHGGAGTTGASLRAGIPTVVKPFFGDQHFFAARVDDLGVGIALKVINSKTLSQALREATQSERIVRRARAIGERIRGEDGVKTAIKMIYRDLDHARSLIKNRPVEEKGMSDEESEESWDLVSDEGEGGQLESSRKASSQMVDFPASLGMGGRSVYDEETSASARSSDAGIDRDAVHDDHDSNE